MVARGYWAGFARDSDHGRGYLIPLQALSDLQLDQVTNLNYNGSFCGRHLLVLRITSLRTQDRVMKSKDGREVEEAGMDVGLWMMFWFVVGLRRLLSVWSLLDFVLLSIFFPLSVGLFSFSQDVAWAVWACIFAWGDSVERSETRGIQNTCFNRRSTGNMECLSAAQASLVHLFVHTVFAYLLEQHYEGFI